MPRMKWSVLSRLSRLPSSLPVEKLLSRKKARKLGELRLIRQSGLFDVRWYVGRYGRDESHSPLEHYWRRGADSGFDPGPSFSTSAYCLLYNDVVPSNMNPLAHYAAVGKELQRLCALPRLSTTSTPPRLCCLVHVFYPDLWPELAVYLRSLVEFHFDLRINISEPCYSRQLEIDIRREFPTATIKVSPNRGHDIGGQFFLLADIDFDDYDVFLLAHTKKAPQYDRRSVDAWRHGLLNALIGTPDIARENLNLFATDRTLGCIGAARHRGTGLAGNEAAYRHLLRELCIAPRYHEPEFVAGTMLMTRSSVLKRLFEGLRDVPFEPADGKPPEFHLDGQLEHAIERIIGSVVRDEALRMGWRPVPRHPMPPALSVERGEIAKPSC